MHDRRGYTVLKHQLDKVWVDVKAADSRVVLSLLLKLDLCLFVCLFVCQVCIKVIGNRKTTYTCSISLYLRSLSRK